LQGIEQQQESGLAGRLDPLEDIIEMSVGIAASFQSHPLVAFGKGIQ
jgi:hypothetical protein